jgi:AraC-like DNA-binding protein/ligand-binding sensor protein
MSEERHAHSDAMVSPGRETDPLLIKAWKALSFYAKATGTVVCVLDQDFLPIREIFGEVFGETNTCIHYCLNFAGENAGINRPMPPEIGESEVSQRAYLRSCPCNLMHINAIKEAHRFGGSCIYMCELGFMFWTSPLYSNGRFAGALIGSGYLGVDNKETIEAMYMMSKGTVSPGDLEKRLTLFPKAESERIKSMAELLLLCAEYLSSGNEDNDELPKLGDRPPSYSKLRNAGDASPDMGTGIDYLRNRYPQGLPIPGYPMDKERMLMAALRRGDNEAGRKTLNELLAILFFSSPDHFKFVQFRAIELVVLLSRAAMASGTADRRSADTRPGEDTMLETNNRYLRRIQEAKSIEELTDVLHIIVERMSGQIFSFQGVRHASALRKAERFIWEHYTRKISLQEIASASGLSAPYFSTIFKEEMGENLSSYLNRLRVEKASHMLMETDLSLSEIASSCGFEDQSWFSKIFKSFTGVSPGKYRGQGGGVAMGITDSSANNEES